MSHPNDSPSVALPAEPSAQAAQAPVRMFAGSEMYDVPPERVAEAEEAGYRVASKDEVRLWEKTERYKRDTPEWKQIADTAAVTIPSAAMSVPALMSNLLPGVDGQSGYSWTAGIASAATGRSQEEIEEDLRIIAETSPKANFGIEAGMSLLGSGLMAGAAKAASKAISRVAPRAGAAMASNQAKVAGYMGESLVSSVALSNEEAFIQDKELTLEMAVVAATWGAGGPLALAGGLHAGRAIGAKAAGKYDSVRRASHQAAMRESDEAWAAAKRAADEKWIAGGARGPRPQAGAPPRVPEPTFISGLFGNRQEYLQTVANIADSVAAKSSRAAKAMQSPARRAGSNAARFAVRDFAGVGYGTRNRSRGMRAGLAAFDMVAAPMAGSFAANVVGKYGAAASGMLFKGLAQGMRNMARNARVASNRAAPAFTPLGAVLAGANRLTWNARVEKAFDAMTSEVASVSANPEALADQIGEMYGGFEHAAPGTIDGVTGQYMRALTYLNSKAPVSRPVYAGVPSLGMMRPPVAEQESYIRRYIAVQNPFLLLSELENGQVNRETVEAVSMVYPSMYTDMLTEVAAAQAGRAKPLTRREEMALAMLWSGNGTPFGANSPRRLAQVHEINQAQLQTQHNPGTPQRRPGARTGAPSLAQSMRTATQKSVDSIHN